MLDLLAEKLTQEKVIGFFQGRFEWGPRALGNRSILADPRSEAMKEVVNTKIKFREPFRPFAPVILRDRAAEYFDYPGVEQHEAPRYMLMVSPIKADKQDQIQAVCHQGTGRLQTIERETNPRYYGVIERFGEADGRAGAVEYVVQPARRADCHFPARRLEHVLQQRHRSARARFVCCSKVRRSGYTCAT